MDHLAMLTPHEQLVDTVLHICQWTQWHIQSILGFVELPVGHRWSAWNGVKNHWCKCYQVVVFETTFLEILDPGLVVSCGA